MTGKHYFWKVCGMREADNLLQVASLGPDMMGFIFYRESPRFVGDRFTIPRDFPKNVKRVGVFVNAPAEIVQESVKIHALDYVQLHGDESAAFCKALKESGAGVIKVFAVDASFDFNRTDEFEGISDLFLFDTKGTQRGGNGVPFDWSVLKNYHGRTKFLLGGGLNPSNLHRALGLNLDKLVGFDLNSGVEVSPGVKDPEAIEKIKQELQTNEQPI